MKLKLHAALRIEPAAQMAHLWTRARWPAANGRVYIYRPRDNVNPNIEAADMFVAYSCQTSTSAGIPWYSQM
jgi:hypothetical protein